ncbi:MAG: hypothetical protein ACR2QA_10175, partial [Solirubrobacteraceae bacterium]
MEHTPQAQMTPGEQRHEPDGGLSIRRRFTTSTEHPFDAVEWELRDAHIGHGGQVSFEQRGVEFPKPWSQNATNIVAQKYFRGQPGSPERERSVKQMISRVAGTIARWGLERGYFADDGDHAAFEAELTHILVHQMAAFNSPVWFNVGWHPEGSSKNQCSACFILSVEDQMESILDWNTKEGIIFRGGSGSGINLSKIRGSMEPLSRGGTASGPVSFMRGADAWAGSIKSGGGTRRAAKMVVLDVDHPDIREFIWCKAKEEDKAAALRDAGFDMSIDGDGFHSIQYQNANNSVRVSDEFMRAVENDEEWRTTSRMTGEPVGEPMQARELMREIAEAAWRCADPGVQYDTTINQWHTSPNSGRINASNPCCFTAETLVHTTDGPIRFDELYRRHTLGETLPEVAAYDRSTGRPTVESVSAVWIAGMADELIEVTAADGAVLRCTPEHRFLLTSGQYIEAQSLSAGIALRSGALAAVSTTVGGSAQVAERPSSGQTQVTAVRRLALDSGVAVFDLEVPATRNFAVTSAHRPDSGVVVHNSEYMHVDDSACNLASLNLMKFRRHDGSLDVEVFEHTVDIMFLAQEIIVGPSSYPTEEIGVNARAFRQLG